MAIQNFLSGGFYGSIGELTGRRWKNKRVVTQKYSPTNPRTEAQQKQRGFFRAAQKLSSLAQSCNHKNPIWDNPIRTEWNMRETIAINALKKGQEEWDALPLYPDDFTTDRIIESVTIQEFTGIDTINCTLTGTNLLANKKYAGVIFVRAGFDEGKKYVCSGTSSADDPYSLSLRIENNEGLKDGNCMIKLSSCDDTEIDTVTVSVAIPLEEKPLPPYTFATSLKAITLLADYTLQVTVKIGNEAIARYESINITNISFAGTALTKQRAVDTGESATSNYTAFSPTLTASNISVNLALAEVSFTLNGVDWATYYGFNGTLSLTVEAVGVEGVETMPTSENLVMQGNTFPQYIQEIYNQPDRIACTSVPQTVQSSPHGNAMRYTLYIGSSANANMQIHLANEGDALEYIDPITSPENVTLSNGQTLTWSNFEAQTEEGSIVLSTDNGNLYIWAELNSGAEVGITNVARPNTLDIYTLGNGCGFGWCRAYRAISEDYQALRVTL